MKKILLVLVIALGLYAQSEIEPMYEDNNVSGLYYQMHYDCKLFNSDTGEMLDDNNATKCKIMVYVNGKVIREATEEEIQEAADNERARERMYE